MFNVFRHGVDSWTAADGRSGEQGSEGDFQGRGHGPLLSQCSVHRVQAIEKAAELL